MISPPTETYWTLNRWQHGQGQIPTEAAIIHEERRGANKSDRRRFEPGTNQLLLGGGKIVYQCIEMYADILYIIIYIIYLHTFLYTYNM